MSLRLAYNTNGFPQHELADVAAILAELDYDGIAITPDIFQLNPLADGLAAARELRPRLLDLGLAVCIETGARFLLEARRKHQPTLLSGPAGAARRLDLLLRCHDIAVALGAESLSFWSGAWAADPAAPGDEAPSQQELLERLVAATHCLLEHGAGSGVTVAIEPEPGMLVSSLADWEQFARGCSHPELRLALDVGHVPVTEAITPAEAVRRHAQHLGALALDDALPGVHEHLLPGDGCIDWPALCATLKQVGYSGLAACELPRHSHDPIGAARTALQRLRAWSAADSVPPPSR